MAAARSRGSDAAGARSRHRRSRKPARPLRREYALRIVSRPREPTGVWRVPGRNPNARNYYLIVEAVAPDGRLVCRPGDERGGRPHRHGLAAGACASSEEVFEQVRRDKNDDGIVQRNRLGEKRRGELDVDYRMPVIGGAILTW